MLTSQEPAELSAQLNSTDCVMAKKAAGLPSLDAPQVLLRVKKQGVREAKAAVALRRKAAAENLTRREGLTARAEEAATQERGLVRERAAARARAVRPEPRTGDSSASFVPSRSGSRPCSASGQLSGRGDRPRQPATARLEGSTRPPLTISPGLLSNPVDSYITSPTGCGFTRLQALAPPRRHGLRCCLRYADPGRCRRAGGRNYFNSAYGNRVIIDHGYRRGADLGTAYEPHELPHHLHRPTCPA